MTNNHKELQIALEYIVSQLDNNNMQDKAILLKQGVYSFIKDNKYTNTGDSKVDALAKHMVYTIYDGIHNIIGRSRDLLYNTTDNVYTYYYPTLGSNPIWFDTWYNYSTIYFWWLPVRFSIIDSYH